MIATVQTQKSIQWGKQSQTDWSKYRLIAISGTVFFVTGVCDIQFVAALAVDSPLQWIWGLALIVSLSVFIASLKSDGFKLLHYVVDQEGVHLKYEIASGPLETTKLVHRTQDWSRIRLAAYSTLTEEDASETHIGVLLSLSNPLECGRTMIELKSDHPEQLMSLVHSHLFDTDPANSDAGHALALALAIA